MKSDSSPMVYISYSRKDKKWYDLVVTHLKTLEQNGLIEIWSDQSIDAGKHWDVEIRKSLDRASLLIFLVSPDSLTSGFIHEVELPAFKKRVLEGNAAILPVIVRECAWRDVPAISQFQVLPHDGRPISNRRGRRREMELVEIAKAVRSLTERLGKPTEAESSTAEPIAKTPDDELPASEQRVDEMLEIADDDLLVLAFHLVLAGAATPTLLKDLNADLFLQALAKLTDGQSQRSEQVSSAQKILSGRFPDAEPNALWLEWTKTTRQEVIGDLKKELAK